MSDVERLLAEAEQMARRLEMRLEQYKLHAMRGDVMVPPLWPNLKSRKRLMRT